MSNTKALVTQAHILADFLPQFVLCLSQTPEKPIGDFYREFENRIGFMSQPGKNVVFTQSALLGIAYILIVFQKESFFNDIPDISIREMDRNEWGTFTENLLEPNKDLKYLLRRMRNSLAHANVDVSDEFVFRFRDKRPMEENFTFDISFESDQFNKFICRLTVFLFS